MNSAQRARAIEKILKRISSNPGDADAMVVFRQLVPELTCPNCGMKFDRYRINQVYCSAKCRNIAGVKRHRRKKQ
jgi:predicted nucleic acid-binding Zn ribbon protein